MLSQLEAGRINTMKGLLWHFVTGWRTMQMTRDISDSIRLQFEGVHCYPAKLPDDVVLPVVFRFCHYSDFVFRFCHCLPVDRPSPVNRQTMFICSLVTPFLLIIAAHWQDGKIWKTCIHNSQLYALVINCKHFILLGPTFSWKPHNNSWMIFVLCYVCNQWWFISV